MLINNALSAYMQVIQHSLLFGKAFRFLSLQVEAGINGIGPRLAVVDVPGIGLTAVAHRKSADEHIKVIGGSCCWTGNARLQQRIMCSAARQTATPCTEQRQ